MKVFISQPMRGISQEEIDSRRQEIIDKIKDKYLNENIEFIYSIIIEEPPEEINYSTVWYLSKSIEKLADATLVYFDKGWEKTRGCQIEYNICKAYNIPTISWRELEWR